MDIRKDEFPALSPNVDKLRLYHKFSDGIDMLVNMIYGESNRILRSEMVIELLYELLMDSSQDERVRELLAILNRRIDDKIDMWSKYLLNKK